MGKGDSTEAVPNTTSHRSILEEYKVGKVIGTGSYGTVYEAYHTKQKVMVAVKIISKKKASEDYLNKFLPRELQVSSYRSVVRMEGNWSLVLSYLRFPRTGMARTEWSQKRQTKTELLTRQIGNFLRISSTCFPHTLTSSPLKVKTGFPTGLLPLEIEGLILLQSFKKVTVGGCWRARSAAGVLLCRV